LPDAAASLLPYCQGLGGRAAATVADYGLFDDAPIDWMASFSRWACIARMTHSVWDMSARSGCVIRLGLCTAVPFFNGPAQTWEA
jgi:hypothetical protein